MKIDAHYRRNTNPLAHTTVTKIVYIYNILFFQYSYDVGADKTINTINNNNSHKNNNVCGKHDADVPIAIVYVGELRRGRKTTSNERIEYHFGEEKKNGSLRSITSIRYK